MLPGDITSLPRQVAYPRTNELYVFNRHGHHVETRDLVTGRTLYSFLYSKNTSFGRLSKVTDSSGNKVMFLRDYTAGVSQVSDANSVSQVSGAKYVSQVTGAKYIS